MHQTKKDNQWHFGNIAIKRNIIKALASDAQEPDPIGKLLPLPGDLEAYIKAFVTDYNHRRDHESIDNLTLPTSTSDVGRSSWQNDKGSSDKPSLTAAGATSSRPPDIAIPTRQSLPYFP